jgi:hypothetical protein
MMFPTTIEPPKTIKPKPPGPPFACIHHRNHGETYCGRSIEADEFLFQDADYAVMHYATAKGLHACAGCVAVVRRMRKEENEGRRK